MPFSFLQGMKKNVCLLESFQLLDELPCIQNCDERNQTHANWLRVALIFLSEIIYIRMFLFVLCEIFACILIHALVLPGIPYRSTPSLVSEKPICTRLTSQLNAPFFVKEIFCFCF